MNFYTGVHAFYCSVDLHARSLYLGVVDATGQTRFHRNVRTDPEVFLQAVEPFREGLVVAAQDASSAGTGWPTSAVRGH